MTNFTTGAKLSIEISIKIRVDKMEAILADFTASITELKKSPSKLLEKSHGETIAILNNNKAESYLVSAQHYAELLDIIGDIELAKIVEERQNESRIKVDLNEL